MKYRFRFHPSGVAATCLAALALTACDQPAPGLKTATVENSVYGEPASGTSTSTPTPAIASAPAAPAPAQPAPAPAAQPAPAQPAPQPQPEVAATPAPAPATPEPAPAQPAPQPQPEAAPAPAPAQPAPAAPAATGEMITIKPAMPAPLFVGTPLPQDNPPPNLDTSGKPTLEVQVPAGVTLLSAGKPVTSSDSAPIGELEWVTDGEKNGADGYYVDLMPGLAWVQIDLQESREIWLIWVWHFHKQNVIFKDVVVQVSDDPEFNTYTTVFNNDYDNSAGFGVGQDQSYVETNNGRAMPVNGVKGRYVRLYSAGRDLDDTNQYIEVEVYGK